MDISFDGIEKKYWIGYKYWIRRRTLTEGRKNTTSKKKKTNLNQPNQNFATDS